MLYQKLLMGSKPYFLSVEQTIDFELHRHPEIELSYCMEGSCDIICESERHTLNAGDFAIIPPMAAHELPPNGGYCKLMTVEVGYLFLGDYFESFRNLNAHDCLYRKRDLEPTPPYRQLTALLEETAALHCSNLAFRELSVKGNLYKISDLLLQILHSRQSIQIQDSKLSNVKRIDKALEIIYNRYYEPLNVEQISTLCGYSKSNFCKIFKSITGDTFHQTLNRHRIEIACILLRDSHDPIERIAQETGFADTKSFCRVFRKTMGKSAGQYRKNPEAG